VSHETTVRVRYGEVDRMGVVYHANYLAYFEVGRTEYLRGLGRAYRDVEDEGLLLVVADAALKFLRPATYDDVLVVRTSLVSLSGVRMRFEYAVTRREDGVLVATGHTTLASTDREGRPIRLPEPIRVLLESHVEPSAPAPVAAGKNAPPSAVQGAPVRGPSR
jgi:acyl-CoA thioester hydrolase